VILPAFSHHAPAIRTAGSLRRRQPFLPPRAGRLLPWMHASGK
jgi:hypothetical protein